MAEPGGSKVPSVVVIGASAGGVEALSFLASRFPENLGAPVLMVIHLPHNAVSVLPDILRRAGPLPAVHASSREPLRAGRIYIAPPDRHMLVTRSDVRTVFGPRENSHRPAIDPLFRSAAQEFGKTAIGVVLTGNLDDGSAGLLAIKQAGGRAIVQDPATADYPGMPRNAIHSVEVDHILSLEEIPDAIIRLVADLPRGEGGSVEDDKLRVEIGKVAMDDRVSQREVGQPSGFTCPECQGGLWELQEGMLFRYRCRVGHAYSADSLLSAYGSSVEAALWAALRSLEENAAFARRLAKRSEIMHQPNAQTRFTRQAEAASEHASTLRDMLASGPVNGEPTEEVIGPE